MKLNRTSHKDFIGNMSLGLLGIKDVKFTFKKVTVGDAVVPIVHVDGVNTNDGSLVDFDMWPRNNATLADLDRLPATADDIVYRIGFHTTLDLGTGEITTVEGQPKLLGYSVDGKSFKFSGARHEWDESAGSYEPWTNEEPEDEEEESAE